MSDLLEVVRHISSYGRNVEFVPEVGYRFEGSSIGFGNLVSVGSQEGGDLCVFRSLEKLWSFAFFLRKQGEENGRGYWPTSGQRLSFVARLWWVTKGDQGEAKEGLAQRVWREGVTPKYHEGLSGKAGPSVSIPPSKELYFLEGPHLFVGEELVLSLGIAYGGARIWVVTPNESGGHPRHRAAEGRAKVLPIETDREEALVCLWNFEAHKEMDGG